jgi:hypothetical protein
MRTTARTHNPAPPTSAVSNCSQGGWGGARTRARMGMGMGMGIEHTMCRGKTDDKDQTMEMRQGPTTSEQGMRNRGHACERATNKG